MWLEHLLFGARLDADARRVDVQVSFSARYFPEVFFVYYGRAAPQAAAQEFIDKFEKDNEVKKNKKQMISF